MRNIIVKLGTRSAIKAIEYTKHKQVYCRQGVWNKYRPMPTEKVIDLIAKSDYGAAVLYDTDEKKYYVSIPNGADMW